MAELKWFDPTRLEEDERKFNSAQEALDFARELRQKGMSDIWLCNKDGEAILHLTR